MIPSARLSYAVTNARRHHAASPRATERGTRRPRTRPGVKRRSNIGTERDLWRKFAATLSRIMANYATIENEIWRAANLIRNIFAATIHCGALIMMNN